jgi:hypothetical protein
LFILFVSYSCIFRFTLFLYHCYLFLVLFRYLFLSSPFCCIYSLSYPNCLLYFSSLLIVPLSYAFWLYVSISFLIWFCVFFLSLDVLFLTRVSCILDAISSQFSVSCFPHTHTDPSCIRVIWVIPVVLLTFPLLLTDRHLLSDLISSFLFYLLFLILSFFPLASPSCHFIFVR